MSTAAGVTVAGADVAPGTVLSGVLDAPTRYLFFTGKGGVGKTSCAATVAVAMADAGRRVLIVSTDPASNLAEVFGMADVSGSRPVPVPGVPGLDVVDIDPSAAAAEYRERVVGPYRGVLPDVAVASIEEELSGSCTVEVAAFNEFVTLLTSSDVAAQYDNVVFDTAPTGHTLRLLSLPAAWTGFLETNTAGVTCVGPVSALGQAQESYGTSLETLRDGALTTVVLVTRAERSALQEADRASHELSELGMTHQRLVVNGVLVAAGGVGGAGGAGTAPDDVATPPDDVATSLDDVAAARRSRESAALENLPATLRGAMSVDTVPLLARAPMGIDGLRAVLDPSVPEPATVDLAAAVLAAPSGTPRLAELVDVIAQAGPGIVMTMGKGGVGKTTVAAAIALGLAERGLPVTLTTTDPAAHVHDVLPDAPSNLLVTRIDPELETSAYTAQVLGTAGAQLDGAALDLLTEDLRSPCTEEVAVFHAFARTVAEAAGRYVVIDTAPTGHTLLLLDSSQTFARQAEASTRDVQDAAATHLFASLSDPDRTRIVLVTLAEATPFHEAQGLQADLARAGLAPYTWVVDGALSATATSDPVLRARGAQEARWIDEIAAASPRPPVLVPWVAREPVGVDGLRQLLA